SWCRNSPKTAYARQLREIFLRVTGITTPVDKKAFLDLVATWEVRYGAEIAARKETGRVFSDIKRARSMLLRALPDMFHYLDDPHISTTTNGLEGYFSRLKSHYRQHRGLSPPKATKLLRLVLLLHAQVKHAFLAIKPRMTGARHGHPTPAQGSGR
ncbi:MAG: hypothetical protein J4N80_07915, partial [Chloroflexi bacterium]|nr:hypothetical protein [Chloroflexota bacterium]